MEAAVSPEQRLDELLARAGELLRGEQVEAGRIVIAGREIPNHVGHVRDGEPHGPASQRIGLDPQRREEAVGTVRSP